VPALMHLKVAVFVDLAIVSLEIGRQNLCALRIPGYLTRAVALLLVALGSDVELET
jgi:hypothetical protein